MSKKKYELATVEDIFDCVNRENVENFIVGFNAMLRNYVALVGMARASAELTGLDVKKKRNTEIVAKKRITYIDDGKQDNKIIVVAE